MAWNKIQILIFLCTFCVGFAWASASPELQILDEWKNIAFSFDSEAQKQYALDMGFYNPTGQKRPYDSDIHVTKDGKWRKFLSVPRISAGVPYTLMEVSSTSTPDGPHVRAYPNMETHLNQSYVVKAPISGHSRSRRLYLLMGAVHKYRYLCGNSIEADCHRLWALDTGIDFTAAPQIQVCPPKIVAIDLVTDSIEFTYTFPNDYYEPGVSVFNSITLKPSKSCKKSTGYVTFTQGRGGLVIFIQNKGQLKSWLVTSEYFKADPRYYNTTIANESFNFIDGIYGVATSKDLDTLTFHPFASLTEYAARLSLIEMEALWSNDYDLGCIIKPIGQRPTQSATEAFDSRGNLFFTLMDPILGIFCWNHENPYNEANFKLFIENDKVFQFVAGLKIKKIRGIGEIIIGLSNRLQKHSTGTVSPNEINYRMFILPIDGVSCSNSIV